VSIEGDNVIVSAPSTILSSKKPTVTKSMKKAARDNDELIVIVGGGCAGSTCAEVLRQEGFTGRILVINRENHIAYDRPKLSKTMNIPLDKIFLRSEKFYDEYNIEWLNGVSVTELDPDTKK